MHKVLILAPARYESSRFPGKPLAKINGKPMIQYVVENCNKTGFDYSIVTDNGEIENAVKNIDGNIVRIDDDVATGSERIALAYQRYFSNKKYDPIINVQGDEPMLKADFISQLAKKHLETDFDIMTAVRKRNQVEEDFRNPDVVKCVKSEITGQAFYFSRASIPFNREQTSSAIWYQHIGVYSYRPKALVDFDSWEKSPAEAMENLEQLRALDNHLTIGTIELSFPLIGVDRPEDIKKVEGVLSE